MSKPQHKFGIAKSLKIIIMDILETQKYYEL